MLKVFKLLNVQFKLLKMPSILCPYVVLGLLSSRNKFHYKPNSKSVILGNFCDTGFFLHFYVTLFIFNDAFISIFFFSFIKSLMLYSVFCREVNHQYITFHQHYYCCLHSNRKLVIVKFLEVIRSKFAYTFILILIQLFKMLKLLLCPKSYVSQRG